MVGARGKLVGVHVPAAHPAMRKGAALVLAADELRTLCKNFLPCFVEFQLLLGSNLYICMYLTNRKFEICLKA